MIAAIALIVFVATSCVATQKTWGVVIDSKPYSEGVWYTRFRERGSEDSILHIQWRTAIKPRKGDTCQIVVRGDINCKWGMAKVKR